MSKDQLIHEIGSYLIEDLDVSATDWAHVVLIVEIENKQPNITGFVYSGDGQYEGWVPSDFEIIDLTLNLRDAMASADQKAPWKAALIRVDRAAGEIYCQFEYQRIERWSVNWENTARRAEELRPAKSS